MRSKLYLRVDSTYANKQTYIVTKLNNRTTPSIGTIMTQEQIQKLACSDRNMTYEITGGK